MSVFASSSRREPRAASKTAQKQIARDAELAAQLELEEKQDFRRQSHDEEMHTSSRGVTQRNGGPSRCGGKATVTKRAAKIEHSISFPGLFPEANDVDTAMDQLKEEEGEDDEEEEGHGGTVSDMPDNTRSVTRPASHDLFNTDTRPRRPRTLTQRERRTRQ